MKFTFDQDVTHHFEQAVRKEWLETNGLGGWASSTIIGANTRRYHGLLIAATRPPVGRMVLLSKLDETIEQGERTWQLGTNQFPGVIHPQGLLYQNRFEKDFFPVFEYECGGIRISKTIAAVHDENTTLIVYNVEKAPGEFVLQLQPFIAFRDYHSLAKANDGISTESNFAGGLLKLQPYENTPPLFILVPSSDFEKQPAWHYNFEYREEQERGLDFQEDLFTHGRFKKTLKKGDTLGVIISTADPDGRNAQFLLQKEQKRRQSLLQNVTSDDPLERTLRLSADQFIVKRDSHLKTIIAGYHWFSDWGRDTMIALPGLTLVSGRFDDARKILRAFARSVSRGMLPNRFPDAGEAPKYNTVDATLWFFIAIYKYLIYSQDFNFIRHELLLVLKDIIKWHYRGTRYNIHVDTDGLLYAGEPGMQLTWMDAKVGDWVVTPRQGKAVEVNALWYNALKIYAEFCRLAKNKAECGRFEIRTAKLKRTFNKTFWNADGNYLYDVVDGDLRDASVRPNQLFAVSLPFSLLSTQRSKQVLAVIEKELLTPVGLRSLSPNDPAYRPFYEGDQWQRDGAYHQGTVWSWLLGPYITALVKIRSEAGRQKAIGILEKFLPHLQQAGIGAISEIFDGAAPHEPRGAVAQAWSVAEILRALHEDILHEDGFS